MFGNKKSPPESPAAEADPAAPPPGEAEIAAPAAALSREQELEAELARFREATIRQLAEAENARKRVEREVEDARKFAVSSFARDLLPVADNLRRALDAIPADQREATPTLRSLFAGVEATERQLASVLEKFGIQPVPAMGQPFDPNLHQAMQEIESTETPPGTVVQVYQTGFTIAGRLLRPALVVVAKAPSSGKIDEKA